VEASGGEWENLRESHDRALRAHARRLAEIEARERAPADPATRADKLTRDRISGLRGSLKAGGKARDLADAAERAARGAGGLDELARAHAVQVEITAGEWGTDGSERRSLRESVARAQRGLERANNNLRSAIAVASAATHSVPESGVDEHVARIEATLQEAGDRLRARLLNQQAALERERVAREREAAERARRLR
jgi:hypothetical protein